MSLSERMVVAISDDHLCLTSRVDDLQLSELSQALFGKLNADSRLLGAAERNVRCHVEMFIDPDRSGLDLACDAVGAFQTRRPDRCTKTIVGRVGAADHVVIVGIFDDG